MKAFSSLLGSSEFGDDYVHDLARLGENDPDRVRRRRLVGPARIY
jgi:hypothetical protein